MEEVDFIDVHEMPLDEWLVLVNNPPTNKQFLNVAFPSSEHREVYINSIDQRSEEEIHRLLLHFLMKSGSLGLIDQIKFESLKAAKRDAPELYENMISMYFYRRLVLWATGNQHVQPWEGVTWVLDLLPHFPKLALEGLNAYIMAHAQILPDWRLHGMFDAAEIIRAKYIGIPGSKSETIQTLLDLHWRDFEHLIERLYRKMGYETQITPAQKDKGRDVIASKRTPGALEHLRIECKLYKEEPIGLIIVQRLLGVISSEKVNKGVLVTSSRFTQPAIEFASENPRLELIDGNQLVLLMNEHLGPRWPLHIDRLIIASKRDAEGSKGNGGAA